MKQLIALLSFALLLFTSCIKEPATEMSLACGEPVLSSSETKDLLTAHTWRIEEVIDPYQGTRYKRCVMDCDKDFAVARYTYKNDQSLTGTDWFGAPLQQQYYTLLDIEKKLKFMSPLCCSTAEILTISRTAFSYKSSDGSIFKLVPAEQPDCDTEDK